MKKTRIFVSAVLSLLLLSLVGIASAYNADYTHTLYQSSNPEPTIDGTYIVDADWLPSGKEEFGDGAAFHDQWIMTPNLYCLIVEVTDNTTDAGDKLTICFDSTADGGMTEPDGGTTPQEYDKKVEVTGHGGSATVQWFVGDGSGWVANNDASAELLVLVQDLVSTPTIEDDHYVYEMKFLKLEDTSLGSPLVGYTWGQFVSYYDEDDGTTQQWPPADATPPGSPDVPDSWGFITYVEEANPVITIPDGISIITLMIVSSAAAAGAVVFRKRTK